MDFLHSPVVATLFYEDQKREVETVKVAPLTIKPHVSEDGDENLVECRIKVLSSQHEDSNFRVRFRLLDGQTGQPFEPDLICWSESVRIVSKPEQLLNAAAAETKPQRVRGLYVEKLEEIRNVARQHNEMLQQLVLAKEEDLRRTGREDLILEDYIPANYAPAPNALQQGQKKKKAKPAPKKRRGRGGKGGGYDDEDEEDEEDVDAWDAEDGDDEFASKPTKRRQQISSGSKKSTENLAGGGPHPFDGCFFKFVAAFSEPSFGPADKAEEIRKAVRLLQPAQVRLWEEFLQSLTEIAGGAVTTDGSWKHNDSVQQEFCRCENCPWRQKVLNMDLLFGLNNSLI